MEIALDCGSVVIAVSRCRQSKCLLLSESSMNVFEFRQWIESSLPWWVPFAIPISLLVVLAVVRIAKKTIGANVRETCGSGLVESDSAKLDQVRLALNTYDEALANRFDGHVASSRFVLRCREILSDD